MTELPSLEGSKQLDRMLFKIAFARARPCYCYGCICLTPQERLHERRVFRMARAWAKMLRRAG